MHKKTSAQANQALDPTYHQGHSHLIERILAGRHVLVDTVSQGRASFMESRRHLPT